LRSNIATLDLKAKLIDGILNLINLDRQNTKQHNRDLIAKLIHILLALQLYKGEFETKFLDQSKEYYEKISESDF